MRPKAPAAAMDEKEMIGEEEEAAGGHSSSKALGTAC
jgi:hypothetical protein